MIDKKLKYLRQKLGISQANVAKQVFISQQAYAKYENGKAYPSNEVLLRLCELFGVSADYILGNTVHDASVHHATRIPVYGNVAAGIPIEAITDIDDYEEIDSALSEAGEYLALRIHGSSMEPKMSEGDVVIVHLQDDVDSGDIAVVLVNGNDATCKKIKKTPEGVMLISLNPAYEPMFYSNEQITALPLRILGRVVELRAKF